MALITCPECGQQISEQASACPHCAYPLRRSPHIAPSAPPAAPLAPEAAPAGNVLTGLASFNAVPAETVDFALEREVRGLSEYERLLAELPPTLAGVIVREMTGQDVDFLVGDTGIERRRIVWLAESANLARETAQPVDVQSGAEELTALPPEVFYGWLSQGLPPDIHKLWSHATGDLMATLGRAIDENIVPQRLRERLDAITEEVARRAIAAVLQPSPKGTFASIGDLLRTMPRPLGREKQRAIAKVIRDVGVLEDLLPRLQEAGLSRRQAIDVQRTLRLAEMTRGHAPLVRELQKVTHEDEDGSLRPLAALRPDEWLDLVYTHGTPPGSGLTAEAYASQLAAQVEALHPWVVLEMGLNDGAIRIDRGSRTLLT